MDLGIKGKNAIVCAASKGLGKGCAMSLAREGVNITMNARTKDALEAAAKEIRDATGVRVTTVAGDITTDAVRAALLQACPAPDILVNNAGGPPPGDFRQWDREAWLRALDANMLTPIFLIKATVDGMIARTLRPHRQHHVGLREVAHRRASACPTAPAPGSRASSPGSAGKTVAHNVTINNILPGPFDTDRLRSNIESQARATGKPFEQVARERQAQNPAGRFGTAAEFGEVCAFVCSAQAGYITGQNFVLDGGAYPGTL